MAAQRVPGGTRRRTGTDQPGPRPSRRRTALVLGPAGW